MVPPTVNPTNPQGCRGRCRIRTLDRCLVYTVQYVPLVWCAIHLTSKSPHSHLSSTFRLATKSSPLISPFTDFFFYLENLGESELREALLKKAEYLATIGDKSAAIEVGGGDITRRSYRQLYVYVDGLLCGVRKPLVIPKRGFQRISKSALSPSKIAVRVGVRLQNSLDMCVVRKQS